eukprot:8339341-Alexandrium_andersonii.AAC.1
MSASLVGSEMCIRDRRDRQRDRGTEGQRDRQRDRGTEGQTEGQRDRPVSYTHLTLPTICSV